VQELPAELGRSAGVDAADAAADEHDRHVGEHRAHTLRDLEAARAGDRHVDHHRVRPQPLRERNRLVAVAGVADDVDVVGRVEERAQRAAVPLVVVDEEHGRHAPALPAPAADPPRADV
jgi:hypothetical protein